MKKKMDSLKMWGQWTWRITLVLYFLFLKIVEEHLNLLRIMCLLLRSAPCNIKRTISFFPFFALQEAGALRVSAPDGVWLPGSSGLCRPGTSAAGSSQLRPQLFDSFLQWWVLTEPHRLSLPVLVVWCRSVSSGLTPLKTDLEVWKQTAAAL